MCQQSQISFIRLYCWNLHIWKAFILIWCQFYENSLNRFINYKMPEKSHFFLFNSSSIICILMRSYFYFRKINSLWKDAMWIKQITIYLIWYKSKSISNTLLLACSWLPFSHHQNKQHPISIECYKYKSNFHIVTSFIQIKIFDWL